MSISKRVIKQRLQILLHRNEPNHKLKQLMIDVLLSERSQLVERDEPKCISSKYGGEKTIQHVTSQYVTELNV